MKDDGLGYVFVQEGGSSRELYLHAHDTRSKANKHIRSCRAASYRTSALISIPRRFLDDPECMQALEGLLEASQNLDT